MEEQLFRLNKDSAVAQIGINLVQLNLGWKSHDCNNSKLCRKISVTVNMQLCITLQKKQSQKEISRDGFIH